MERLRLFRRAFYAERIHCGAHRQNIKVQPIGVALFCIDFDKNKRIEGAYTGALCGFLLFLYGSADNR